VTRPQIESLSTLVAAMDDAASRDDIGAYYPLNLQFHEALVAAADNYKLAQLWPLLEAELHLFRRRGLILEGSMRTSNDEHQAILQALIGARHALAGRLAERHIVAGKNRFLRSLDDRGEQPRPTLTVDSLTKPR
jgi:DNA-binding GntR family transcriptional regulator